MGRRARHVMLIALLLAPAVLGAAAFWVLPRAEVPRDVALPPGDWLAVAAGDVREGGSRHAATGNVTLFEERETLVRLVYLQGYEARAGPNVWFHLTPDPDPASRASVQEGVLLGVPGLGPAVARGTFWLEVPDDVSPHDLGAVVAWDRYLGTRFAVATLQAMPVALPAG